MAHNKSAKKRIRTNEKRRIRNKAYLSELKTITKKVKGAQDKEQAAELLKKAISKIDKTAVRGIIHRNTASRRKAALTKHVNNL